MTVESDYAIAILSHLVIGLRISCQFFSPVRSKTKTNRTLYAWFFPRFEQVTGNCQDDSDWSIVRFAPAVIGRSNYYCFFRHSFGNHSTTIIIIITIIFIGSSSSSSSHTNKFVCYPVDLAKASCYLYCPQNYFRDFWNVFDFFIVITTLVGFFLELNVSHSSLLMSYGLCTH